MNAPHPAPSATNAPPRQVTAALWILLAAAACFLILNRLVTQSFFFDGTIYASIARNMAEGTGSAWSPHFSSTLFPVFAEHPPLMMWLESLGFRVFGDTIAVEKGFSLLTFLAAALLLWNIWARLHNGDVEMQRAAPLALFMALVAGRLNWAFGNGMLENLLMVFTSAAVLFVVTAYDGREKTSAVSRTALIACAGLATALALLTKGPVGLFPLAAPALYWLSTPQPSFRAVVFDSVILLVVIVLFYLALWSFEAPRQAIQRYLDAQLLPSLAGERGHGGGGWTAVRTLLRVNAYPVVLTVLALAVTRRWRRVHGDAFLRTQRLRRAAYLFLLGSSASLPLLASPRIASFYFNPALAYFAAGLCTLCAPAVFDGLGKLGPLSRRRFYAGATGLLAISLITVGWNFGRPGEDRQAIENAGRIAGAVCAGHALCADTVSGCGMALEDWALYAYMQRYYKISIAPFSSFAAEYIIADDTCRSDPRYNDAGISIAPYRLLRLGN